MSSGRESPSRNQAERSSCDFRDSNLLLNEALLGWLLQGGRGLLVLTKSNLLNPAQTRQLQPTDRSVTRAAVDISVFQKYTTTRMLPPTHPDEILW